MDLNTKITQLHLLTTFRQTKTKHAHIARVVQCLESGEFLSRAQRKISLTIQ